MLVYDCEIVKAIPPRNSWETIPGIEYCAGWEDYANMGIAVLCAYDYVRDEYRVFGEHNILEFFELCGERHLHISFNGERFDRNLLAANYPAAFVECMEPSKEYDILHAVYRSLRLPPKWSAKTHGGYSLDAIGKANGIGGKTGDGGAMAPVNWQRGNHSTVIDYCLRDVRITKGLVDKIIRQGWLADPKRQQPTAPAGGGFGTTPVKIPLTLGVYFQEAAEPQTKLF